MIKYRINRVSIAQGRNLIPVLADLDRPFWGDSELNSVVDDCEDYKEMLSYEKGILLMATSRDEYVGYIYLTPSEDLHNRMNEKNNEYRYMKRFKPEIEMDCKDFADGETYKFCKKML